MQQNVTLSPPLAPRQSQRALLVLAFCYFMLIAASLSVVGLSGPISAAFGITPAHTGLLVSAFALAYAVSALLVQGLVGHLPRKTLLLSGLGLLLAGLLLGTLAQSFTALLLTRVLAAVGASVIGPVASATGSLLVAPEQQPRALATVLTGLTLASVLAVPLASLLGPLLGWRGTLGVLAGLTILAAGLVWRLIPAVATGQRVTPAGYVRAFRQPGVGAALGVTLLQNSALFVLYGVIASYLAGRFNSSHGWVSATLLTSGVLGVLGNAVVSSLIGRLGTVRVLALSLVTSAFSVTLLLLAPAQPWLGLVLFSVWWFFASMFQAPQQNRLIDLYATGRGLMLALNSSVLYLGIGGGSWLGATLLPVVGAGWLALLPLGLLLASLWLSRAGPVRAVNVPGEAG